MRPILSTATGERLRSVILTVWRTGFLLVPTGLLLIASLRHPSGNNAMLWMGTAFQIIVCVLAFANRASWGQPIGPSVVTLYLIALTWLWFGDFVDDWYNHFAKSILLVIPLAVFGYQTLYESGAPAMRRANALAQRLAQRQDWPSDLQACRTLTEVKALRAALSLDAAPALALLQHPRLEVRVAALAALEFRKDWRPGQAELVMQVAQRAEQPALRAAAVTALGNLDDRPLVETLAQFLHDTSREVRKAATEALLWDTERRWSWIRYAVRRILADPLFLNDGPLLHDGQLLTSEAVKDLTAWCAEKGVISARAGMTLGAHFNRALNEQPDAKLARNLRGQLGDPHTPAILRLELARVLQYHQELDGPTLEKMLDPANPAPIRLISCETILIDQSDTRLRNGAMTALRDLARLPNREIALATADVIQRRLGVDLGLGLGQPLPPIQSKQAAEITRRVMHWASQNEPAEDEDERKLEDSRVLAG
ncbi:MAG: HEAT repeat domain-containing protein [Planctomycetes bacterium]|nr:HEAT repeat domain-containing protein [Planctomycetota bacterium]